MPNESDLTVYGPPDYLCSSEDLAFPDNTKLVVTPPSDGCTICFSAKVDGKTQYNIPGGTTKKIEFKGFNTGDTIDFCTCEYETTCDPTGIKDDGGHTITIDTGTR